MCEAIDYSGHGDEFGGVKSDLLEAVAIRNTLAHASVAPSAPEGAGYIIDEAVILECRGGQLRRTPASSR